MEEAQYIIGDSFRDNRGVLNFFNSFNMNAVVRMYEITPNNTNDIRGWQAHKLERKWMYCSHGRFLVKVVRIDDFLKPSASLEYTEFILDASEVKVLYVPSGCATAIKMDDDESKLIVFSDSSVEVSKADDYRFDIGMWKIKTS